jgi:hypothetical protein|tara:strand:+ start:926 stop:1264 length:339 start_codon:yes stop_codon:yes gene_type:complete
MPLVKKADYVPAMLMIKQFLAERRLAQLAVLAATAVEAGLRSGCIARRLARHTGPCPGQGAAARFGNFVAAFDAIFCSFSGRHIGSRALDRVGYCIVYLILHRTIACPAACH